MTVATNALYTPGAIGNVTKRTGDLGQGLEPDEGQLSRPVLRGLRLASAYSAAVCNGGPDKVEPAVRYRVLRRVR